MGNEKSDSRRLAVLATEGISNRGPICNKEASQIQMAMTALHDTCNNILEIKAYMRQPLMGVLIPENCSDDGKKACADSGLSPLCEDLQSVVLILKNAIEDFEDISSKLEF